MNFVRGIITALFVLFGFAHLLTSFNTAQKHVHKITWATGIIGVVELALAYAMCLV